MSPAEHKTGQPQPSPEHCRELFDQKEYLQGLTEWFSLPQEARDAAIDKAIQAGLDAPEDYLPHVLDEESALGEDDRWVLTNFAILTSPTTQALLNPNDHNPLDLGNLWNDFDDYTATYAQQQFTELVNQKRNVQIAQLQAEGLTRREARQQTPRLSAEAGHAADFQAPNEFIRRHFSVEEMRSFISSVLDKTPPNRDLSRLLNVYDHGVIGIDHQELILDDALMARMPEDSYPTTITKASLGDLLGAPLRLGGPLPSSALVEKAMELKPDQLGNATFRSVGIDNNLTQVPVGSVYMGLIRRIAHSSPERPVGRETYAAAVAKTVDYLSSPAFMSQLMPYIASDAMVNDVLWSNLAGVARFEDLSAYKDRQPQDVKREWLKEVVNIVVAHLMEIGDEDKAELVLENTK